MSFLDAKGAPTIVERAWILPPASRIGPLTTAERTDVISASVIRGHYEQAVDRESAYEKLKARAGAAAEPAGAGGASSTDRADAGGRAGSAPGSSSSTGASGAPPTTAMSQSLQDLLFGSTGPRGGKHEGVLESAARSAARSIGSGMGRQILRGVLGSMFGGRR